MSVSNDEECAYWQNDFLSKEAVEAYSKQAIDRNETMSLVLMRTLQKYNPNKFVKDGRCKNGTLLDIGCGNGKQTEVFSKHFDRTIGIDISETQILTAKAEINQPNVEFLVSGGESLPVSDGAADALVGVFVAHFLNMKEFIKEVKRVLKPGGIAVLTGYMFSDITPASETLDSHSKPTDYRTGAQLWENCRMTLLRHAESISHPERHALQWCKSIYDDIEDMKKRYDCTVFEYDLSLKRLHEYMLSIPFYGSISIEDPFKILCSELKTLWGKENVDDDDVIARLTCKTYIIVLMNE